MSSIIPVTGKVLAADVIGKALGRTPTAQELIDLAPVAVMVQAFIASAEPGDVLQFENEAWFKSYVWGLHESSGQRQQVQVEKGSGR